MGHSVVGRVNIGQAVDQDLFVRPEGFIQVKRAIRPRGGLLPGGSESPLAGICFVERNLFFRGMGDGQGIHVRRIERSGEEPFGDESALGRHEAQADQCHIGAQRFLVFPGDAKNNDVFLLLEQDAGERAPADVILRPAQPAEHVLGKWPGGGHKD
jgi:hypothetical protein